LSFFSLFLLLFSFRFSLLDETRHHRQTRNLRIHNILHVRRYPTFLPRVVHPPASRGCKARGGPETHPATVPPLPAELSLALPDSRFTRISRPRTCMCTTVLRKNYAGHKVCRPTARQSNFYQSKVTYHGELGLCRTHATMHTSPLHSFSLCPHRFLRPPTFSLFTTQSSRS